MKPAPTSFTLEASVLSESVRLIEEGGPLDDATAMRAAMAAATPEERIASRASELGRRTGLQSDIDRMRRLAPWIGLALTALVVVAGLALAGTVTGNAERRINVMAALLSLLGLHALTLVLWLAGLLLPWTRQSMPRASFGWLWMALTARVAGGRVGQTPVLLRAAMRLLSHGRLVPWAMGIASHAIWTLSFIVVLGTVLFALAFHRYTLGWETTLLDPDFFVRTVRLLGWLPQRLGFPMPEMSAMPASGALAVDAPGAQRALAWWLTGCIAIYGLLPRVLALLVALAVWHARKSRLRPDLSAPYYRKLLMRFDALVPATIVDPDLGPNERAAADAPMGDAAACPFGNALVIAAFELAENQAWPPADLPALLERHGPAGSTPTVVQADGSAGSRRALLDTAARLRPRLLVLVCRAVSSPDRGTERLLRELGSHCGECRLWLMGDTAVTDDGEGRARWRRWLADTGLGPIAACDDPAAALEGVRA